MQIDKANAVRSNLHQAKVGQPIEVDSYTGETKVLKVVSAVDAGGVINPVGLEGQSEGGV